MTNRPDWLEFAHTTKPDIWILERILNTDDCNYYDRDQIKAIRLKYQAMTEVPSTIEKNHVRSAIIRIKQSILGNRFDNSTNSRCT